MSLQLLCTCSQCVHYCWTPFNFFAWRQLGQRKLGHWQLLQALCDRSIPSNTTLFLKPIQVGPAIISLADSSPSDTLSLDHQQWLANHSWSSNFWIRKCLESIQEFWWARASKTFDILFNKSLGFLDAVHSWKIQFAQWVCRPVRLGIAVLCNGSPLARHQQGLDVGSGKCFSINRSSVTQIE